MRRLEELLRQMIQAAKNIGNKELEKCCNLTGILNLEFGSDPDPTFSENWIKHFARTGSRSSHDTRIPKPGPKGPNALKV